MVKRTAFFILLLLLASSVNAINLKVGESYSEVINGKNVIVYFTGMNTQDNPGATFLNVNGRNYMIQNGTTEKIGDLRVSVADAIVWDNLSGGEIYVTLTSTASCDDNLKNQLESDVDCGGPCKSCLVGMKCKGDYECKSRICSSGICLARTSCNDLQRNSDETDVDCGGSCKKCNLGKKCEGNFDCASNFCRNFSFASRIY